MNGIDANINLIITIFAAAALILFIMIMFAVLFRKKPQKLNRKHYEEKWKEVQSLCADKTTWPLAIINGDKLLDEALKKRRYKGKTMGERLVSAQRTLSDNDGVWYGHKLRNKLVHEDIKVLTKVDVKDALLGFRQALKDLGAF